MTGGGFGGLGPGFVQNPRKVVAGIVLLRDDGAALLQLRDDKPSIQDPGIWAVPGGHIEPGETPMEGACREFLEETCYLCANARPLTQFTSRSAGYPGDFDLAFFWDRFDGIQRIECREGQALEFISRLNAEHIPRRDYLTRVWDLALSVSAG
jgi:8-oxo-dGTP pyrophosphatase MutT (NUDIX family)